MGIRSRIKNALSHLAGGAPADVMAPRPEPPRAAAPASRPAPPAPAPAPPPPAPPAPAPAEPDPSARATPDEKAAKHWEKTRRAVLNFVADKGGQSELADMHSYSEARYFVAHRRFSDMMEGLVAEGLLEYDSRSSQATLTEAGRRYLQAPTS